MSTALRPSYFIRFFLVILSAYAIVVYTPVFSFTKFSVITNPLFGLILFIFLSGFLINQVMDRNKTLQISISLELSRTRRIVHLSESIHANGLWKKALKKKVIAYVQSIGMSDLIDYKISDAVFRSMTHEIYQFVPKTPKDQVVFEEMLFLTRELASQRQTLIHDISSPISPYIWIVFSSIGLINIFLLLLVRDASALSTWFIFFVITMILLICDLLLELSVLTKSKRLDYQKLYVENSKRIAKE